jgi:hypothetical protein
LVHKLGMPERVSFRSKANNMFLVKAAVLPFVTESRPPWHWFRETHVRP